MHVCEVTSLVPSSATPSTVVHQAPLSMGFSRQEYCSGLPFPSPGDRSDTGIKPGCLALQADSLPSEPAGKPRSYAVGSHQSPVLSIVPGVYICQYQSPSSLNFSFQVKRTMKCVMQNSTLQKIFFSVLPGLSLGYTKKQIQFFSFSGN